MYTREPLPYYAGLNTYFRSPLKSLEELKPEEVAVLGVPLDVTTVARSGGRWGPDAIRRESLYLAMYYQATKSEILDVTTGALSALPRESRIFDVGDVNMYPVDIERQTRSIIDAVSEISGRGAFPVVLGGDHYVAYPSFEGFAAGYQQRHPGAKLGYLHIDSHTDFIDEISFLGRYNHGTSARRVSENPAVLRMAWVGINWPGLVDLDQYEVMKQRDFAVFPSHSARERGIQRVMREALDVVCTGTDAVYVSLDIDVVDGAYAPGTHSQVFGGITSRELLDAMGVIAAEPKVQALDVCEVLPAQDGSHRTERLAAVAILTAIAPRILEFKKHTEDPMASGVFR